MSGQRASLNRRIYVRLRPSDIPICQDTARTNEANKPSSASFCLHRSLMQTVCLSSAGSSSAVKAMLGGDDWVHHYRGLRSVRAARAGKGLEADWRT